MNKYSISFISIFLLIANLSFGQFSIGLNSGISQNKFLTNTQNEPQLTFKKKSGYYMGLGLKYEFSNYLSISIQPSLIKKNYKVQNNSDTINNLIQKVTNSYIQLPLAAIFTERFKHLSVSIKGGGFLGYWIKSYGKGTVEAIYFYNPDNGYSENDNGAIPFNSKRDNRLEYGWLLGGEVSYRVSSHVEVNVQYNFYQSLSDQQKNYMIQHVERFNRTQTFGIGIIYSLVNSNQVKIK